MKNKKIIISFIFTVLLEIIFVSWLFTRIDEVKQDVVSINECVKQVEDNFYNKNNYCHVLDYSIIDLNGNILYKNNNSSNSINEAIKNNDTILDLNVNNEIVGKILFVNNTNALINKYKNGVFISVIIISLLQILLLIVFLLRINKNIILPFKKLDEFARRIADGNLDVPLYMDKKHIFGSFSESFDLMRSQLKKTRLIEKKFNDEKKEMVAKLSHDIKTPIASIKSTSEIGFEKAKDEEIKNYFNQINIKTDQIKILVDNLFNSSVNEVTEISVSPSNYESDILKTLISNADYLNLLGKYNVPKCSIYIDKVRMQQVIDNIIINSYKYANTNIDIYMEQTAEYLIIKFRDYGAGVHELDLPLLKEKYKRGRNVKSRDGAGLGLYLANYYMDKMNGKLELNNATPGFEVVVYIRII